MKPGCVGLRSRPRVLTTVLTFTNISGDTIYIGLIHIAELEKKVAYAVIKERIENGDYRSLRDFANRVDISKEQLEILIRIGAFRFTGMNKYALMWEKNAVHNPHVHEVATDRSFFGIDEEEYVLPVLEEGEYEQAFDEIELLGFPLCSPFDLLTIKFRGDILTRNMEKCIGKIVRMVGYYVARKNVTTVNKRLMNFGTWLDVEGLFFDTTHFPPSLARYPFKGKGCYIMQGKIVEDFGFPSMEVDKMEKLPWVQDERY